MWVTPVGHPSGVSLIVGSTLKVWEEMGAILAHSGDSDSGLVYFPFGTPTHGRNDQVSTSSAPSLSWQDTYVTTY